MKRVNPAQVSAATKENIYVIKGWFKFGGEELKKIVTFSKS